MPIAKPDTARTPRGIPVVIAVLSNDQGGSLTVAGYTLPTYAEAAMFLSVCAALFLTLSMVAVMNRSIAGREST